MVVGCQPYAPTAFTPRIFLVLIFTRGWVDPRATVRSEGNIIIILLLQSALQPLFWFRSAQLSLSILSRKVFTECCCQQHAKPPTWSAKKHEMLNNIAVRTSNIPVRRKHTLSPMHLHYALCAKSPKHQLGTIQRVTWSTRGYNFHNNTDYR